MSFCIISYLSQYYPATQSIYLKIFRELWLKELLWLLLCPVIGVKANGVCLICSYCNVFQNVFVEMQISLRERYQISLFLCPSFGESRCPQDC